MLRASVDDKWVIKMTVFLHLRLKVGVPAEASGMHRFGEFVTPWFHPNSSHVDQGVHWRHWVAAFNAAPGLLRCTYGSLMTQEVRLASQTIVLRYTREHYLAEVNLRLLIRLLWETCGKQSGCHQHPGKWRQDVKKSARIHEMNRFHVLERGAICSQLLRWRVWCICITNGCVGVWIIVQYLDFAFL